MMNGDLIAQPSSLKPQQRICWRYCTEPEFQPLSEVEQETCLNLIALGRTGDGKSSLLNDLMGSQVFKQKISAKSQTKDIQSSQGFWAPLHRYMHHREKFGCQINVIDTPGFGDSQNRDEAFFKIIQEALVDTALHSGIHCILMVFKITTSSDTIYKSLDSFQDLISPYTKDTKIWRNVLLVFTHVDIVNGNTTRYQSHKVALKTKVNRILRERYKLDFDLPMLWISTQKFTCGYLKGFGDCDCEKGNRYHSDCRRRLYEQVMKRRSIPFALNPIENSASAAAAAAAAHPRGQLEVT